MSAQAIILPKCILGDLVARGEADPREQMILALKEQNQELVETVSKATSTFQNYKATNEKARMDISKNNEKLQASVIDLQRQIKEMEIQHQAQIKAMKEKDEQRSKEHLTKINKILELVETVKDRQIASIMSFEINTLLAWMEVEPACVEFATMTGPFHDDFTGGTVGARVNYLRQKMPLGFIKRQLSNGHMPDTSIFVEETKVDSGAIKTRLLTMKEDLERSVNK